MFQKLLIFVISIVSFCQTNIYAASTLSFGDWELNADGSGWAEVRWSSTETIAGFQFDVTNIAVTSVEGGLVESYNWATAHSDFRVLAYASSPATYIPPQEKGDLLIRVHFEGLVGDIAFEEVLFADENAKAIKVESSDTIIIDYSCQGVVNEDFFFIVTDLLAVVCAWGLSVSSADVTGDGVVNVSDLLAIMDAWGPC